MAQTPQWLQNLAEDQQQYPVAPSSDTTAPASTTTSTHNVIVEFENGFHEEDARQAALIYVKGDREFQWRVGKIVICGRPK